MSILETKKAEVACSFCLQQKERILFEDKYAFVYLDLYPVSTGHSLIIPKRHFKNLFEATSREVESIWILLKKRKDQILMDDKFVSGFNVGVNVGLSAGQSIFHLHVHLIPRRIGDVGNPKGGVRGVIPSRMNY